MQYEYLRAFAPTVSIADKTMEVMGKEGWELISVTPISLSENINLWFKRTASPKNENKVDLQKLSDLIYEAIEEGIKGNITFPIASATKNCIKIIKETFNC